VNTEYENPKLLIVGPTLSRSITDLQTIVYHHLKQPRELVKAKPVTKLFA
jgi:hypothetical protein